MHLLAYHITWGTYGTRLHGDPRGTVDRQHNQYQSPILRYDGHRWEQEKDRLKFPQVILSREQMIFIESFAPAICDRGHWTLHAAAARPDYVHIVLTSPNDPEVIRKLAKRWLSQELMARYQFPMCWAECGSIRWIDDADYFAKAVDYVKRQRATAKPG